MDMGWHARLEWPEASPFDWNVDTNLLFGRKGILASLSGVHRELSWLLSVVRDTESDMRDGDEQLLLFWLLLATVSSSKESASSVNEKLDY